MKVIKSKGYLRKISYNGGDTCISPPTNELGPGESMSKDDAVPESTETIKDMCTDDDEKKNKKNKKKKPFKAEELTKRPM